MDLESLSIHLGDRYDLALYDPVEEIPDSSLAEWLYTAQRWKDSGRSLDNPTDAPDLGDSNGEEQIYSDIEEIVISATKPSLSKVLKQNIHDSSSDYSSSGRKKSKNSRNSEKALAGVKKLELSQSNTDTQLKTIADSQNEIFVEIKSMLKSAQSDLKIVKGSVKDLYDKHEIN